MILNDATIRKLCVYGGPAGEAVVRPNAMIEPFSEGVQGGGVISYGLSHAGYDLRLGDELLVFKNTWNEIIDPNRFKEEEYRKRVFDRVTPAPKASRLPEGAYVIPGHCYALGAWLEYLRIPTHLKGRCVGKSTLARCGVGINTTPLEPGWCGHLTIEIANHSQCPVLVFARQGIAQLEFEQLTAPPEKDYGAKGGKYQSQGAAPAPARVKD